MSASMAVVTRGMVWLLWTSRAAIRRRIGLSATTSSSSPAAAAGGSAGF